VKNPAIELRLRDTDFFLEEEAWCKMLLFFFFSSLTEGLWWVLLWLIMEFSSDL